jgi:hypothetical protein
MRTALLVLSLCMASCATYADRTARALRDFESGNFAAARGAYDDPSTTGSEFLQLVESGTVAWTAGDLGAAQERFDTAGELTKQFERAALISSETLGEEVLSWAFNDTAKSYEGEGYERVLLHVHDALTRLERGDRDGARVEAKRANVHLENDETLYKKSYRAGGLGHFLSALTYEMDNEPDNAWIDYQRMVTKGVGLELAGKALVRLARRAGRQDELEGLVQRFGQEPELPEGAASIVVICGVGFGPEKFESGLAIPLEHGVARWVVPVYRDRYQPVANVDLVVNDSPVRAAVVEDIAAVARENLADRIAWMATKSAVRNALKYEMTRRLGKDDNLGTLGTLAGIVYTLASERADLRAWRTLPHSFHAARVFVAPGTHSVRLAPLGGATMDLGRFELARGETMFVFARTLGSRTYARAVGGQRLTTGPTP